MDLVRVKVSVKPKSPLVLGGGSNVQNVWSSLSSIPGSVLRGALAQLILKEISPEDRAFQTIFTSSSPARFGWLYPLYLSEDGLAVDGLNHNVYPAPCTAWACKAHGTDHGLVDTLSGQILRSIPADGGEKEGRFCRQCEGQERLERWRGFVARGGNGRPGFTKPLRGRPLVRVGLNRMTETAEEGILYVLEALPPRKGGAQPAEGVQQLVFVGYWTMTESQWEHLKKLLEQSLLAQDNGYQFRIGTARSRGMGKVVLRFKEVPLPTRQAIAERIDSFQPKDSDGSLVDPEHLWFSLTARSPVLVLDEWGLPAETITPELLSFYANYNVSDFVKLCKEATLIEREALGGWSQTWGMPKPVNMVIAAGSVFTYCAPVVERDAIVDLLADLETTGIGERLSEGLGDLVACDELHAETGIRVSKYSED